MSASVGGIVLRPEMAGDEAAVRTLLQEAFGGPAEATLVDHLRAKGDLAYALVAATASDEILGYVGFSLLRIENPEGTRAGTGLAPLAVVPSHQRRGIGSALVRAGLDQLIARREEIVFVLGDPALYSRFGLSVEDGGAFTSPYAGPHFMALRLHADAPDAGTVSYPRAFAGLR